jgi:hypothetical protein
MKNKEQAIVVSYYLSRFNDDAVNNLGYKTWKDAFDDLSDKLQINKHTIKIGEMSLIHFTDIEQVGIRDNQEKQFQILFPNLSSWRNLI